MTRVGHQIGWKEMLARVAVDAAVEPRELYALAAAVESAREFFESSWGAWVEWDAMRPEDRDALNALIEDLETMLARFDFEAERSDPLEGANCTLCGATADNFHVSDDLWERVGLGHVQACFKCFRIAAWNAGVRPDPGWQVSLPQRPSKGDPQYGY